MTVTTDPKSNARIYWDLFDGVPDEDSITGYYMYFSVGGHAATDDTAFQATLYARKTLDTDPASDVVLYRRDIYRPSGEGWVGFVIGGTIAGGDDIHCLVLKLEAKDTVPPSFEALAAPGYHDQVDYADDPPWGLRVHIARVYASDLGRTVTCQGAIEDICEPFFTVTGDSDTSELDQLYFKDIPCSRREALETVLDITGQDYAIWEEGQLVLSDPESGPIKVVRAQSAGCRFSFEASTDETYNKCRVTYTNEKGKPREVICEASSPDLPDGEVRANTIDAPTSVQSAADAKKLGDRYLRDHRRATVSGHLEVKGDETEAGDALLIRPGDRFTVSGPAGLRHAMKATHVSLDVLDWRADVSFEVGAWRFDRYLARLAAGAHARRR